MLRHCACRQICMPAKGAPLTETMLLRALWMFEYMANFKPMNECLRFPSPLEPRTRANMPMEGPNPSSTLRVETLTRCLQTWYVDLEMFISSPFSVGTVKKPP